MTRVPRRGATSLFKCVPKCDLGTREDEKRLPFVVPTGILAPVTTTAQKLQSSLLALPEADRAELAHLLLESLEQSVPDTEERAFDAELARRADEIRNGKVTGHTPEELFARLDARLDSSGGQ